MPPSKEKAANPDIPLSFIIELNKDLPVSPFE
jgi:hypothetical protein